jgi:bifunctional ADP-heptose synthase (sugar kinase/adenylyltransferase)
MSLVQRLLSEIEKDRKTIIVIGDAMVDQWIHGYFSDCQDGCQKFVEQSRYTSPGGADNAASSLCNWDNDNSSPSFVFLFRQSDHHTPIPVKTRFVVNDRIAFRHDREVKPNDSEFDNRVRRTYALNAVKLAGGVLLSDYDKGFLTPQFIRQVIDLCNERGIPCVADAKREPELYEGALLKCNTPYFAKHYKKVRTYFVATNGPAEPCISGAISITCVNPLTLQIPDPSRLPRVPCINHVGAGDCFAAHLTLALAYGFSLVDAATLAHSAGRVYVQSPHNRPPQPQEIEADLAGAAIPATTFD